MSALDSGALTNCIGARIREARTMAHLPRRQVASRRIRRTLLSALGVALLALPFAAAPVGATVILRDHYSDDYGFSFDDCGYWLDVAGHDEGVAQLRVGKGELATAFFLHDNYSFLETWTRRDTGDFFTLGGNGCSRRRRPRTSRERSSSSPSINAGQPFLVWDFERQPGRPRSRGDPAGPSVRHPRRRRAGRRIRRRCVVLRAWATSGLEFDVCAMLA